MKVTLAVLSILIVIYVLLGALLFIYQRTILYIPSPPYNHDFEQFDLQNEQEILKITILNPGQSRAIIYFGGNAEATIFTAEPFLKNFSEHTVYLANYRGYSGSSGAPTEVGLYSDSLALYDRIESQHDSLSLLGRSLGSGVAMYLASQRNISQLALITPFDSITNVAQARIPIYPLNLLLKDKYDSAEKASKVTAKVLIVMAELDSVIPNPHSLKLSQAFAKNQVTTLKINGTNHNNVSLDPDYFLTLTRFFNSQP